MKNRSPSPGDGLRHPVPLLAFVVLGLNDHLFKRRWPGLLTGKLSDIVGMVCFPLLLVALAELIRPGPRPFRPSRRALILAVAATGLGFALVKTWAPAGALWAWSWGAMQWPVRAIISAARGAPTPPLAPVALVRDPTDLIALPALGLALWVGGQRARRGEGPGDTIDGVTDVTARDTRDC